MLCHLGGNDLVRVKTWLAPKVGKVKHQVTNPQFVQVFELESYKLADAPKYCARVLLVITLPLIRSLQPLLQVFDMRDSLAFYEGVLGARVLQTSGGDDFLWCFQHPLASCG